jgi:23S rRNA (guanosine2251-2'-O)-methyltransferase
MASAGIGADVEGFHTVAAAVDAGRVRHLFVESGRIGDRYRRLRDAVLAAGGEVEEVDDVRPVAVTGAPQGVVARCVPIPTVSLDDAVAATTPPALLVLDHVEDPRNVGAAARSAVAAGMGALVVSTDRAAPLEATAFKAAAGTLEALPVCRVSSIAEALRRLDRLGVWTVGLDAAAEQSLLGHELLSQPVALVIGAEGRGLSRLVAERCSLLARIPAAGEAESLNASVAASLAMFEVARVRGILR